jgi:hypothetical protein
MNEDRPMTPIYLMIKHLPVTEQMSTGGFSFSLSNDRESAKKSMVDDGWRVFQLMHERFLEDLSE